MEQTIKIGLIGVVAAALVAGGLVGGLAISGGLSPDNAPAALDSTAQSTAPYAYGPGMMGGSGPGGMMGGQQGYGFRRGGGMMGGQQGFGPGRGFRGGNGGQFGYGPGMMGGQFGYGPDMMGGFGPGSMMGWFVPDVALVPAAGETLSLDGAAEVAEAYIAAFDGEGLELAEVMEFSNHFYAQAREESTGIYAFEFLIDAATGAVHGEPGPNMMWNAKYGHMGSMAGLTGEMAVSPEEATELAQAYLDDALPGTAADEEADIFYGYYTLHVLSDGEVAGMLSVNGTTGQVWLHTWHGDFVDMVGHGDE